MKKCFRCEITEDKVQLMDMITGKGIVQVCRKCYSNENAPLIKKPNEARLNEPEKKGTVYERLSRSAGITRENVRREPTKQDENLRQLVEKNFEMNFKKAESHDDLVENFHWVIMRVRRSKKITAEQLAQKINEPVAAIKMAERGLLPAGYPRLIKKIEDALGIRLGKNDPENEKKKIEVVDSEFLGKPEMVFDGEVARRLTISDLKKAKENSESYNFNEKAGKDENDVEFIKMENLEAEPSLENAEKDKIEKKGIRRFFFGKK
ncbi:hypothetical protein J4474_02665 [Candidatus Pacearchaeota archaeon]|nr:hypothetical protein [Candidatus Pacearchaeota archaeon]